MTDGRYLLALDSGSQSSRALLFSEAGEVLAVGRQDHAPMKHPEPGAVEQDPVDIREALFASVRRCLDAWGGDANKIAGAALTTQRSTVLPVAKDGTPLRDAQSWLDRRTAGADSEPGTALRTILKTLGEDSLIPRLLARSWPRQWRERDPQVLEEMAWIAPIEAWLVHQLTGHMAMAPGGVVGPWPFDAKTLSWSDGGLMYKLLAYRRQWLPAIVPACGHIGGIAKDASEKTGLPEGLPLFACGGDKQAEALGGGVRAAGGGVAAVSLGTGSSICIPWKKPVSSARYHWITLAAAEPGAYCLEYLLFRGMWTVRWFARELARDLFAESEKTGRPPEALLCDEAEQAPPGCGGMVVWPRWSPTLQHPMETGSAVGLRETHTRGHFFRALLEGIAYDLKRGLGILESAVRKPVKRIHVGGGGARSDLVVRILADVIGVPVVRPKSEELAARGAAIVAAAGSGVHGSVSEAVKAMVPEAPVVTPDADTAALYDKMYTRAYLPGLDTCRGMSRAVLTAAEAD